MTAKRFAIAGAILLTLPGLYFFRETLSDAAVFLIAFAFAHRPIQ